MSNFFNYSSFPGIRPRSDVDAADMSRSSAARRITADVVVAAGVLALFGVVAWLLPQINEPIGPSGVPSTVSDDLHLLPYYALRSVFRMFIALFLSLVFSFIYGLAAARCRRLRMVLIPLLDILQSVPILGFLSATVTIWMVLFPRLHSRRGGGVDLRNLHQPGMEHDLLLLPFAAQRTAGVG